MASRYLGPLGLAVTFLFHGAGSALAADPLQVRICPSRDKVENILQSDGKLMPDGCRTVTVTRVQSPAGSICSIDFGQDSQGILGTVRDAVTTTQWWTACSNLQAPRTGSSAASGAASGSGRSGG